MCVGGAGSPECGNGIVEPGENCDGNCPTSCDDGDVCTRDMLRGTDCNISFGHALVTKVEDLPEEYRRDPNVAQHVLETCLKRAGG
jgi:hypothetical protein